jgi:hypothetical protein
MVVEPGRTFKESVMKNEVHDVTFEDLQRTPIRTEQYIGHRPSIVYRLGDFDDTVPLSVSSRQQDGKDVYYSAMVLMSFPPTTAVN